MDLRRPRAIISPGFRPPSLHGSLEGKGGSDKRSEGEGDGKDVGDVMEFIWANYPSVDGGGPLIRPPGKHTHIVKYICIC